MIKFVPDGIHFKTHSPNYSCFLYVQSIITTLPKRVRKIHSKSVNYFTAGKIVTLFGIEKIIRMVRRVGLFGREMKFVC